MKYSELEYYSIGLAMLLQAKVRLSGIQKLELIKLRKQFEEANIGVNEARIELCKEYAEEDENGNPMMKDNSYVIKPSELVEFNMRLRQLYENEVPLNIRKTQVQIPSTNDLESQAIEVLLLISSDENIFQP